MPYRSREETKEGKFKGQLVDVLNTGITEDTTPARAEYRGGKEARLNYSYTATFSLEHTLSGTAKEK